MSQNDVDEPVATSVDSNSESDHANDLILYESDSRNGSGSSEDENGALFHTIHWFCDLLG